MAITPPDIRISEFAISGVTPSGGRHLQQPGSSGFIQNLGTGAGEYLDFGSLNNTFAKKTSPTKVVLMNVDNFNDANEAIFNMRFWASNVTDFTEGTFFLNGFASGIWFQNLSLNDASGLFIGTSLPSGQNLFRQDGNTEITTSGVDEQASQFVYLSVTVDTNVPVNVYGGNAGGFTYRITTDFK